MEGSVAPAIEPEIQLKAADLTPASIDAYKEKARQLRGEAIRRFQGRLWAQSARFWHAAMKRVSARNERSSVFLSWIAKWRRARRAALTLRVQQTANKGLAAID